VIISLLIPVLISSCAPSASSPSKTQQNRNKVGETQNPNAGIFANTTFSQEACAVPAMVSLWQKRASDNVNDLPIGPGDVIDVSVPEIDEIQNQRVRVSALGTISLPLIGTLEVEGLSENQLRDAINHSLLKYMKHPRVELFVENYRSRGVAVAGAVQKPGNYDMVEDSNSLMDMIGLAGGLSPTAAQEVIFSPVHAGQHLPSHQSLGTNEGRFVPTGTSQDSSSDSGLKEEVEHSIVLNLDMAGEQACLGLPVRPGDAVLVPIAGQVLVDGWVQNPGAYNVTPGMTLLGAVSAAGGANFSWSAQLLRSDAHGGKTINEYSLTQLRKGEETDPSVHSGDVVWVERSAVGAVPYTVYTLFQHFGSGIGFPIP
jgi:polysaccharide biosynthesis/export protein